ncbi:MAG: AAA family ATPase [Acidimicrobiia bacterium]
MTTTVRPHRAPDLGRILRLWEEPASFYAGDGLTVDQAVDLIGADSTVTLVAEGEDGQILGVAVGELASVVGWITKLAVSPSLDGDREGVVQLLLDDLEGELAGRGARRLAVLVTEAENQPASLERRGYERAADLVYLERNLAGPPEGAEAVAQAGGRMVSPGLWESLKGMEVAKDVIERRVVLPLSRPDLASRHAVDPPSAIMLFGPPGTGKTTFAKGLASLLGWPFVEIQPGELAADGPDRQAQRLAQMFDRILALPNAVVFVDEVEEIASIRHTARKVGPSVTNEFLKQVPRLRQSTGHLLVCATNAVGHLDPAVLRPGRFGFVLPVGPPDEEARRAIWARFTGDITDEDVHLDELVATSERFTPADIEFAARKAAQVAFEREHFENVSQRATTADFLAAIAATRPTVSEEMAESFRSDAETFTRQ